MSRSEDVSSMVDDTSNLASLHFQLKNSHAEMRELQEKQRIYLSSRQQAQYLSGPIVNWENDEPAPMGFGARIARVNDDIRHLRNKIDILSRSKVRKLSLLTLPDEIVMRIFSFMSGPQLDEPPSTTCNERFYDRMDRQQEYNMSVRSIKSLRLTCQRICDLSSHLLLHSVQVEMTLESLAHLKRVSNHPTIRRGIKTVRVLTSSYDHGFVSHYEQFCLHRALCLDMRIDDEDRQGTLTGKINRKMSTYVHPRDDYLDGDYESFSQHDVYRRAHDRYKSLFVDQESLRENGTFIQAVIDAMAKMPRAKTLHIHDKDRTSIEDNCFNASLYPKQRSLSDYSQNEELLIEDMARTNFGDFNTDEEVDAGWSLHQAEMLFKLPIAIHKAGLVINNMSIQVTNANDFNISASYEELRELSAAMQRLKQFTFYCSSRQLNAVQWPPSELKGLIRYLSSVLDTDSLEKLDINLAYLGMEDSEDLQKPTTSSLGPLFANRVWPKLKSVYLSSIPLHLPELKQFMDNLQSPVEQMIIISMYLISGKWADGLEIFKRKSGDYLKVYPPILADSELRGLGMCMYKA